MIPSIELETRKTNLNGDLDHKVNVNIVKERLGNTSYKFGNAHLQPNMKFETKLRITA